MIYNKVPVQSAKKKFHYLNYFFFPRDSVMMMYRQHYLLLWFDASTSNYIEFCFQVLFLVLETEGEVWGGNVHYRRWILRSQALFLGRQRLDFFLLLFSSRKNTNTGSPHHSGALRRVKFDIFWLEGDGILLTLCKNANQNVSKCAWSFPSNPDFPPSLSVCHIFEVAGEYTEI